MEPNRTIELPKIAKIAIIAAIVIPLVVSIIFTIMQWYPATYVIRYMTDENGTFPLKSTVMANWLALMVIELCILIPVALVIVLIRKMKP